MTDQTTDVGSLNSNSKSGFKRFLPRIGSPGYHLMLSLVAILILGPLGGISAAFMNFSIGFFVGGQVLAGILGSTVTLPYGPEGKHGANYMQTMAASVAGMCAMAVLVQAMVWMGLPEPPMWQLVLYFLCIGMFGVGVGMLYTPILVDRMRLAYPSGYAVANILRALTDTELLKRSILKLGTSMLGGYGLGLASLKIARLGKIGMSVSTVGAGMIVGARIAIPALVIALIGLWQTPYLVKIHWLAPGEPYKKIGFVISLGTIMGAAILDISLILWQAARKFMEKTEAPQQQEDWKRVNTFRLILWIAFWGTGVVLVGSQVLHQPVKFLLVAVGLSFIFVLINGISQGISDWNPISSAFVVTVFILAALGLHDPGIGLLCAAILLIATSEGGDMQQDRSTGWRLGTNRIVQFRYQVIGIAMGAILAVVLAKVFMDAYPILRQDQFAHPNLPGSEKWQSAMTFKFVGSLRGITTAQPHIIKALELGIVIGFGIEVLRRLIKKMPGYKNFSTSSAAGQTVDFLLDAVLLPNPYASSFGGFVDILTVYWWTAGGLLGSLLEVVQKRLAAKKPKATDTELPADMSTVSLLGGGLIAGDALAALTLGLYGLISRVLF
jgi:uncharacterized oligopeptide transporter (OPT) family protein